MSNAIVTPAIVKVFPAIPHPHPDVKSLHTTMLALKEAVEVLTKQRGNPSNSSVVWNDLVALGIVNAAQVPTK